MVSQIFNLKEYKLSGQLTEWAAEGLKNYKYLKNKHNMFSKTFYKTQNLIHVNNKTKQSKL